MLSMLLAPSPLPNRNRSFRPLGPCFDLRKLQFHCYLRRFSANFERGLLAKVAQQSTIFSGLCRAELSPRRQASQNGNSLLPSADFRRFSMLERLAQSLSHLSHSGLDPESGTTVV
jgi:hypothetical protein